MATKVLNIDISQFPMTCPHLEGYEQAYVVYWFQERVVGQKWLPVTNGRINQVELEDGIFNPQSDPLWAVLAQEQLPLTHDDPFPKPTQRATVAVCSRDRPEDVQRCLEGFMQLQDDGQQFLIVDNAPSTDATYRIVQSFNGRVEYIREDRPGLDIARNRALREAKHDIIAFNDDDAIPNPNWLRALLKNFTSPHIMAVTGLTLPLELETKAQERFEQISPFSRGLKRVVHQGTPLRAGHVGAGANMALRRSVLDTVGGFDEALDSGTATKSGGDTEMFARILANGYGIVYDPTAVSWHRHRRSWQALKSTMYGYGVGTYAMWTRMLLKEKNRDVFKAAWLHFRHYQLPMLIEGMTHRETAVPLDLALAELRGCLKGSLAYWQASRKVAINEANR